MPSHLWVDLIIATENRSWPSNMATEQDSNMKIPGYYGAMPVTLLA